MYSVKYKVPKRTGKKWKKGISVASEESGEDSSHVIGSLWSKGLAVNDVLQLYTEGIICDYLQLMWCVVTNRSRKQTLVRTIQQ
jgi:hypothetical protein